MISKIQGSFEKNFHENGDLMSLNGFEDVNFTKSKLLKLTSSAWYHK